MVGQDHVVGHRNEQRRNHVFGLVSLFTGRADGHGGDRGRGLARKKTGKEAKITSLAACQGLERASVVFCNVGGHGGCLPGGGAGGPFSGPRVHPDDAGPDLLKAGCGHAATDASGAADGNGMAWRIDPEPDRYSRCFVLPVKGLSMIGRSDDYGADARDASSGSDCMKKSGIAGRVADRIGLSQSAAGNAVDAVFEAVGEALANGEEVRIVGFGTFTTKSRLARTDRNPRDR